MFTPSKPASAGSEPTRVTNSKGSTTLAENVYVGVNAKSLSLCSTKEARKCISFEQAAKHGVLPLGVMRVYGREVVSFAVESGYASTLERELKFVTDRQVKLIEVPKGLVADAIFIAYHRDDTSLMAKVQSLRVAERRDEHNNKERNDSASLAQFRGASGDASQFLVALVDYAIAHGASDIHIIPSEKGSSVKLRIDGELHFHEGVLCSIKYHQQIVSRIKVLCSLDSTIKTSPQDGSFNIPLPGKTISVRVSVMPTIYGEKVVMRLGGAYAVMSFEALGLDWRTEEALRKFMKASEGMIIFAGPTGCGKTTSMYAIMQELAQSNLSLVSIEDPVEIRMACISQTSVNEKAGLDYSTCLKSVVRQDPDVILLGEIRDTESAKSAFQAALTGHLLLTTVHARNVFEVLLRLALLGLDPLTIAQALNLMICQRLVPVLCERCKVFDLMGSNAAGFEVYKPVGCRFCDSTGYAGRALAVESLSMDSAMVKQIITGGIDYLSLRSLCNESNYSPLKGALAKLLQEGKISAAQFEEYKINHE